MDRKNSFAKEGVGNLYISIESAEREIREKLEASRTPLELFCVTKAIESVCSDLRDKWVAEANKEYRRRVNEEGSGSIEVMERLLAYENVPNRKWDIPEKLEEDISKAKEAVKKFKKEHPGASEVPKIDASKSPLFKVSQSKKKSKGIAAKN